MAEDRRLQWVMANRAPRKGIGRISEALSGMVSEALQSSREQQKQLASLLAALGDHEFQRHCRVGEVREGVLAIEVDEPGLISTMRGRWATRIESTLCGRGRKAGVRRILFKFGRSGERIPMIADGMSDRHG